MGGHFEKLLEMEFTVVGGQLVGMKLLCTSYTEKEKKNPIMT